MTKAGGRFSIKALVDMIFSVLGYNIWGAHGIQQRDMLNSCSDKQRHDVILGKIDVEFRHDGNGKSFIRSSVFGISQ